MTVRTRFAPSPTGNLHIGGARTALFSWLLARKHEGQFILRIEDTDLARSTNESVNTILESMKWLGLEYDEGPFYQTQRLDRYQAVIKQLLKQGDAYNCYCSKERINDMRIKQISNKQKPRYDGYCRHLIESKKGAKSVIRFKNPLEGRVTVKDIVRGNIEFQNTELDDLVIARLDGSPTYNLTVVVDDLDMKLTHVIRGDDHLNNSPRQINIFTALNASLPIFVHVPMILGDDGKRLSKRHGAVSVLSYRDQGFLPEALLNYLVKLGWSHKNKEILSIKEMIQLFDIDGINKSSSNFNIDKLLWLNQQHIKNSSAEHIAHHLSWHMKQLSIDYTKGPNITEVAKLQQKRSKTLLEMAINSSFFYQKVISYDVTAARKNLTINSCNILEEMGTRLSTLNHWHATLINQEVKKCSVARDIGIDKVAQPIRVAITGNTASPSLDLTLELLSRKRTLEAIHCAINWIKSN
ncbi:MAG: glutamate--tRNA ligase [Piscirickettsiaceae bacterium]|nr:glutamate--tRNA ligase [Piscirickettsiaceae bacterium]